MVLDRRCPYMDDIWCEWLRWPYNRRRIWPKFPDICLTVEGKPWNKPQPGNWTRPGIGPTPPAWEETMLPAGGLIQFNALCKIVLTVQENIFIEYRNLSYYLRSSIIETCGIREYNWSLLLIHCVIQNSKIPSWNSMQLASKWDDVWGSRRFF